MIVFYKCRCMRAEAPVEVRERRKGEDIVEWMESAVSRAISAHHSNTNALCMATAREHVKIPAPESAPFIGAKPALD